MSRITVIPLIMMLMSCSSIPNNIVPVSNFELERYMGQWYEIARLDHRFERDLSKVTANYSIKEDGSVRVENRGFSEKNKSGKVLSARQQWLKIRN